MYTFYFPSLGEIENVSETTGPCYIVSGVVSNEWKMYHTVSKIVNNLAVPEKQMFSSVSASAAQHVILRLELAASRVHKVKFLPFNEGHQPRELLACLGLTANLLF